MLSATPSHNLDIALDLARAGAYVFPCQAQGPNKKQPCKAVYWRSVSTKDKAKIIDLWRRHPDAVPGIDLAKTGLLVIDCDRKPSDGLIWLTEYAKQFNDQLEEPPAVDTPSGGRHLYYRNDFEPKHGNSRGALPAKKECGIDVRGAGGFVIAPEAEFTDGSGRYTGHGSIFDAAAPPDWLRSLLKPERKALSIIVPSQPVSDVRLAAYGEQALSAELLDLASTPQGSRNEEANRIAFRVGQLVGGGCLTHQAAYNSLEQAVLSWGVNPRDKALGPNGTLSRALKAGEAQPRGPDDTAVQAVEIKLDVGERIDTETGEITQVGIPATLSQAESEELPDHLTHVPGLVGQLTDWITDTALYPQRGLSLGAALTIVGTAAGRHLAGPTRSGTHLYVVCLAPSGAGKDHPLSQISTVLAAADMRAHIGPSQFISMPAVIRFLQRVPLSVCAMDEFGSFLKRINSRKASGFEGAISGMLRTAWGCSFKAMATPEWAQQSSSTIFSPALSIFGAVTAPDFYSSLEGGDVTNGVLNRFLLIETKVEPAERVPLADPSVVPPSITLGLKKIYNRNPVAQLCQSTISPAYDALQISHEAEKIRRDLVKEIRTRSQADRTLAPFLARTAENAIRLATILSIGQFKMEIDEEAMNWAKQLALWSTETLARGAGLYIADSDTQAAANAVRRAIQERGGRVRRRDLLRALGHRYKTRELEDVIKSLAEAEDIVVEKIIPATGGTPTFWYSMPAKKFTDNRS